MITTVTHTDHPRQCGKCFLNLAYFEETSGPNCPNCGELLRETRESAPRRFQTTVPATPGAAIALIGRFWKNVFEIIFSPQKFFSSNRAMLRSDDGLSSALAFAVIVNWIAAFFNFVWSSTVNVLLSQKVRDFFHIAGEVVEEGTIQGFDQTGVYVYNLLMSAGSLVLSPFLTLFQVLISTAFVHFGIRIFMSNEESNPRFATTLKILCYCTAPMILCVIPGVGLFLAFLLWIVPAVVGLSTVYRSTGTRAVLAIFVPSMIFGAVLLLLIFMVAVIGLSFLKLAI